MQIYYIGLIRTTGGKSLELTSAKELSSFSFFERSSINQFMTFLAETIAERTQPGERQSVEEKGYVCHAYNRSEGLACAVITDKEYPIRPAHTLMNKVLDEYLSLHPSSEWAGISATTSALTYDALDTYIKKYQNPAQADSIMKVQQELDETKVVLHKTIESVLARGEKLDSLVNKSEALSSTSKMFYKQAKLTNSCCVIV